MKLLTELEEKVKENNELTKEELIFLYEIGSTIEGFGYEKDPRIEEIKSKRDIKEDLSIIFNCRKDQIGTTMEDFDTNDIVVYASDIEYLGETVPKQFQHLKAIIGDAKLNSLKNAENLNNLEYICGSAHLDSLEDARDFKSLKYIGGYANLPSLEDSEGLESLEYIGGGAYFDSLEDARCLNNLKYIGRNGCFYSLLDAEPLKNCNKYDKIKSEIEERLSLRRNK